MRIACTMLLVFLFGAAAFGQATLYYDPTYTGGSNNGTQAHPYASWSTLWTAINSDIPSAPVTVYLSAIVTDTNEMDLSQCTATVCQSQNTTVSCSGTGRSYSCSISGTNLITFDGISEKNTGSVTVPNWVSNGVTLNGCIEPLPTATNPPTYTCAQNTASRYTIQTSVPITGPTGSSAPNNCVYNFQIQGIAFQGTSGQSANLTYVGNLVFQYNEVTRIALGSGGPGLYIGPGQNGPCHTGAARPGGTDSGPDNVVVQFDLIHDEWGESIYDGASTSDPLVASGSCTACQQFEAGTSGTNLACGNGCTSNSTRCPTPGTPATCSTGAHHRIIADTVFGSAAWGGQGDGMDIKDGHSDLIIKNNQLWPGRYPNCAATSSCTSASNLYCSGGTNAGTSCTSNAQCTGGGQCSAGNDGRCMVIESVSVVEDNFVEGCGHDGIDIVDSWNTSTGRSQALIDDNIAVNINSGVGHNNGLELEALNVSGLAQWGNLQYQNNSVFNAGNNSSDTGLGISIASGSASGTVLVENNIVHTASNGAISAGPATADHNDCYNSGGTCSGTGTITGNPLFVSTASPYVDTNFKISSGSPAIAAGVNLFSTITTDYFGNAWPNSAFDIGADHFTTTGQWYISNSGSDSNNCTALGTPCLTFGHLMPMTAAGDTINVLNMIRLSTSNSSTAGYISAKANQTFVGPSCTPTSAPCTGGVSGSIQFTSGQILGPDGFGNYHVTGQTQAGTATQPTSDCDTGWTGCIYPEDLFVNGTPFQHMNLGSEATLAAGTWWFDYTNHIIYLPALLTPTYVGANTVETSILETAFNPNSVNNVTINQLTVKEFAVPLLKGAIDPSFSNAVNTSSLNWMIENSYVTLNHGYGVRCAFGELILNNVLTDNGNLGTGGGCTTTASIIPSGVVVQGNTITFNNYAHVAPGFGAGGIKFGNTANLVIRGNTVNNNTGNGIHLDDNSISGLIDGNTVEGNIDSAATGGNGSGIICEISQACIFRNNYIQFEGTGGAVGVYSSTTTNVQAYCNVIEQTSGTNGIWNVGAANRGNRTLQPNIGTPNVSTGNDFHHNTIIWDSGTTGTVGYLQNDPTNQPNFFANNTAPDYNTYHNASAGITKFFYNNNGGGNNPTAMNFTTYQGTGADVHGTIDTVYTSGFPAVSISSPTDQSSVANPVTVNATASDGSGIANVQFYVDWTLVSTINSGPYNYSWAGLGGTHVVAALATANSGVKSCNAVTLTQATSGGPTPPSAPSGLTGVIH